MHDLPAGLVIHCEGCGIVIPADAPRPEGGDCAWVVRNKMAPFHANETVKGQHTAAAAAWHMIYHRAIQSHPESGKYLRQFKNDPIRHFSSSQARQALTAEHVQSQRALTPNRDAHFYAD